MALTIIFAEEYTAGVVVSMVFLPNASEMRNTCIRTSTNLELEHEQLTE